MVDRRYLKRQLLSNKKYKLPQITKGSLYENNNNYKNIRNKK